MKTPGAQSANIITLHTLINAEHSIICWISPEECCKALNFLSVTHNQPFCDIPQLYCNHYYVRKVNHLNVKCYKTEPMALNELIVLLVAQPGYSL